MTTTTTITGAPELDEKAARYAARFLAEKGIGGVENMSDENMESAFAGCIIPLNKSLYPMCRLHIEKLAKKIFAEQQIEIFSERQRAFSKPLREFSERKKSFSERKRAFDDRFDKALDLAIELGFISEQLAFFDDEELEELEAQP